MHASLALSKQVEITTVRSGTLESHTTTHEERKRDAHTHTQTHTLLHIQTPECSLLRISSLQEAPLPVDHGVRPRKFRSKRKIGPTLSPNRTPAQPSSAQPSSQPPPRLHLRQLLPCFATQLSMPPPCSPADMMCGTLVESLHVIPSGRPATSG